MIANARKPSSSAKRELLLFMSDVSNGLIGTAFIERKSFGEHAAAECRLQRQGKTGYADTGLDRRGHGRRLMEAIRSDTAIANIESLAIL